MWRRARRIGGAAAVLAVFLAVGAGLASARTGQDEFVRCTKCGDRGARPCGEHRGLELAVENDVLYCSAIAGCAACGGAGWIDCPQCANRAVEERLAAKLAGLSARRAALAVLDAEMGWPLRVLESAHFVVVCELGVQKIDKRKVAPHEVAHLYAARLERLFADYCRILGVAESEFAQKPRIMLWANVQDHERAALRFCHEAAGAGVKLLGVDPTYSVAGTRALFADDELLHRNVVHNTTHLLLSHQRPILWIGNQKGGWADEGLAHWFEDLTWGRCDNFCFEEVNTIYGFKGGQWRVPVRRIVVAGEVPSLPELFEQNTTMLSPEQHAVSFSLVDYLAGRDATRLNRLLVHLREKMSTRDALRADFDLSVLELEEEWRAWVLATYPAR
ncbi:MAG: hypothetical protein AB1726_15450 [Planctomycetota bacterium]